MGKKKKSDILKEFDIFFFKKKENTAFLFYDPYN